MNNGSTFVSNVYNSNNSFLTNNPEINIEPSAEIVNNNPNTNAGALTLNNTWDLSTYRFGPAASTAGDGAGEPGILTLRAAGNLVFSVGCSLTDGFDTQTATDPTNPYWTASLMPAPTNGQAETLSWSYNLIAGADLGAADFNRVQPLTGPQALAAGTGSVLVGEGAQALSTGSASLSSSIVPAYYQVIRTGTGDIDISAGRDVQLLNPLATIYTAGAQAPGLPNFSTPNTLYLSNKVGAVQYLNTPYPAQYSENGGNVAISAQGDIAHYIDSGGTVVADSSDEMPTNWLYRRGDLNSVQGFATVQTIGGRSTVSQIASTSWWIDFSNFFEGVGALGGGNVTLTAGGNVTNVDAVVPTNARVTNQLPDGDKLAVDQTLVELGGGDVSVNAGGNIDGGVYYVERGQGTLDAGGSVLTNPTRSTTGMTASDPTTWLPTTLFLGQGSFDISAGGSVLLGSVANPFLLPEGINNSYFLRTYFSTLAPSDAVDVDSLTGGITFKEGTTQDSFDSGSLTGWYSNILGTVTAQSQPWLLLDENTSLDAAKTNSLFTPAATLFPATFGATAFSGNIDLVNSLTLAPSVTGTLNLMAAGSINGLQLSNLRNVTIPYDGDSSQIDSYNPYTWYSSTINLSDANPRGIADASSPVGFTTALRATPSPLSAAPALPTGLTTPESGDTSGTNVTLQNQEAFHADVPTDPNNPNSPLGPLHASDNTGPVHLYAAQGDISGLTLFSAKSADVVAGTDVTDIGLYIQNVNANDVSVVSAGRDIIAYDANAPLLQEANTPGNIAPIANTETGDIQIAGPGTLEVVAGRNLTLGVEQSGNATLSNGPAVGITSVGKTLNPALPANGADVVAGASLGGAAAGLGVNGSQLDFTGFIDQFLTPTSSYWAGLLPELQTVLPLESFSAGLPAVWPDLTDDQKELLAPQILDTFYLVLRDAGRNRPSVGNYNTGFAAIAALFPANDAWRGDITLTSREIKTESGGDIDILAPGGQLTVGLPVNSGSAADQGILTDDGGNISIFTNGNVNVGVSRIFTLYGGNVIIWSSTGNIAAGSASKTVSAAPPTRVLVDPQSGSVETDLAGLATGGGIGVLATVVGVAPGDVDLIAPAGFIDAGDAGIRASGTVNVSAVQVLNASNIQAGGTITGTPAPPAAPNVASIASASNTSVASSNAAAEVAKQEHAPVQQEEFPSIITVLVVGYGGSDMNNGDDNSNDNGSGNDKDKDKERNT
jgi:hypothetical protein